jgi:hypothetical protein
MHRLPVYTRHMLCKPILFKDFGDIFLKFSPDARHHGIYKLFIKASLSPQFLIYPGCPLPNGIAYSFLVFSRSLNIRFNKDSVIKFEINSRELLNTLQVNVIYFTIHVKYITLFFAFVNHKKNFLMVKYG